MALGAPREIENSGQQAAITPARVRAFREHGRRVLVEGEAGAGGRISDRESRGQRSR